MFLCADVIPVSLSTGDRGHLSPIPLIYRSHRNAYHTSEQFLTEYVDIDRILLQHKTIEKHEHWTYKTGLYFLAKVCFAIKF